MNIERRAFPLMEIRMIDEENSPKITGYAAVFNELSENLGGFREQIAPGAFAKTIQTADVRALWNHDPNFVLGRNKSGTLQLAEDERGLRIEIIPPDAQWAKDLIASMKRGDVDQMSFGFRTVEDVWEAKGKENIRTLKEVELFDVSIVTYPAYPQTSVQARSLMGDGLDLERLSQILVRYHCGLPLLTEDRDFIGEAVNLLNQLTAKVELEPSLANEANQTPQVRNMATLRRKLELLKRKH
ncbi:HK97 family phage prohead protease [Lihuaxuella thermophila]|uniref:Phage prohead protease, HK97 family n=1 Tax=Lihuaxuella thermophila TaxID=1173111 RepID=A0A1H8JGS8_9BACL|nr:HK97 family phage prohead protease [Lihuaxuella thermophila]SEN79994.1 phage prohead protease, HK97 family [Lihuaxuella thermophila]